MSSSESNRNSKVVCGKHKLGIRCIRCHKEWEKTSTISHGPNGVSGSLCKSCFLEVVAPTIRKKQLEEGNFDCFGKAGAYCDQADCRHRSWCLFIDEYEKPESV